MAPEPAPSPGDTESRPADASPKNALSCAPFSKKFPLRSTQLAASHSRVPIILVPAHDDQEAQERALRAGAVAFLGKPFSEEALLTAVRSPLE